MSERKEKKGLGSDTLSSRNSWGGGSIPMEANLTGQATSYSLRAV